MDALALEPTERVAGEPTAVLDSLCPDLHRDCWSFHLCVAHCSGRSGSIGWSGRPGGDGRDQCTHDRCHGGSRDTQWLDPLPGQLPGSASPGLPGKTRFNSADYHGGDHLCYSPFGLLYRVLAHPGWRHRDICRSLGGTAFPAWSLSCSPKKFGVNPDPLGNRSGTPPAGAPAVRACPIPQRTPFRTGSAGLDLRRGVCLLLWPSLGEQLCQDRPAA